MALILPQTIKIKWTYNNKKIYEEKYNFTNYGDYIDISILDLHINSSKKVECKCDYCNNIFLIKYFRVNPNRKIEYKSELKTACPKCLRKKVKDITIERYGVNHTSQLANVKEKTKQTNLKKYGCVAPMGNKEVQKKYEQTCLDKYGTKSSNQSEEIKKKIINTMLKRYGVNAAAKNPKIYAKVKRTNLKKYGVDNPAKNKKIRNKMAISWAKTIYKNGTGPCSKQQKYIHNLINGELNYPVDKCLLDIAFPEEMLYIEYDGGGHNLNIKRGNITQEEFNIKEIKRNKHLKSLGWKLIRIISSNDLLPSDEVILQLINDSKEYLINSNHSWYEINIDKKQLICSEFVKNLVLNDLRYIKKEDIKDEALDSWDQLMFNERKN